ncbi:MAG: bifunctional phosphopantothenoylcysteine decarboxylase/phosphopantothenate--cysteine ligase CoaBC [Saprospiraceae bacterium]|nr:bifunctional phosphopantothenoylcysteine decarboxylase/phosphopantothenate--cysteine ligase CoaBC [Saprospiraceae bacterium]
MSTTLDGKKIILCITGSIAAYKAAFLVRLLIKTNADVRVIMTPSACSFITPLTLSTLSKHEVHTEVSDGNSWNNHVELGLWADAMIVAPCTATTLGKMANGIADNMVVATYLSAKCPVFIAPAMDLDMWKHPSTKNNIDKLTSYGNQIIPVGDGELASGLSGEGRMAEPEDIIEYLSKAFAKNQDLQGKKILITAGPTYEAIDPVRFIGNRSSGKMGIAIAEVCAKRGAHVELVLGPSKLEVKHPNINCIRVQSAEEMFQAAIQAFDSCQAAIMAAAVADYTPQTVSDIKIKKKEGDLNIPLKRTKDIAGHLGSIKKNKILIGFALETNNEIDNANRKLQKKNLDFIVLNSLNDKGAGFQHDTNKIKIFKKSGESLEFELKLKSEAAEDIINELVKLF